jgi:hypothetical protein
MPKLALGAVELLLCSLPFCASWLRCRSATKRNVGIGDRVVEAVGLDALCRALPREQDAVIVGAWTERGREVTGGNVEGLADVLLPVHRHLGLEPGDALAKCVAFGLPRRGIREV